MSGSEFKEALRIIATVTIAVTIFAALVIGIDFAATQAEKQEQLEVRTAPCLEVVAWATKGCTHPDHIGSVLREGAAFDIRYLHCKCKRSDPAMTCDSAEGVCVLRPQSELGEHGED